MDKATAQRLLRAAGDDQKVQWKVYKKAWNSNVRLSMEPQVFETLFYNGAISMEAANLAEASPFVADLLRASALKVRPQAWSDTDRFRVIQAVLSPEQVAGHWRASREDMNIEDSSKFVFALVRFWIKDRGRAEARHFLLKLWPDLTVEEEQEAALSAIDIHGAGLTTNLLRDLGEEARALARSMFRRGILRHTVLEVSGSRAALNSANDGAKRSVERISMLLECVAIPCELRDARLSLEEIARLDNIGSFDEYIVTFANWAHKRGIMHRHEVIREWRHSDQPLLGPRQVKLVHGHEFQLPLLRVLHMRALLESPELRSAIVAPTPHFVPEIFQYMLDIEGISYFPELRVAVGLDRRFKARWAESMGEAISVLFMEEAVDIDLTLLERIPETNQGPSADFKAATGQGEPVVFESKGSTDWATHRKQLRRARKQLLKDGVPEASGNDGRAFAAAFYGALHGENRSTRLCVEDPPFGFERMFGPGWEELARRRHFASMAQFAGLPAVAERLLGEDGPETDVRQYREPDRYVLSVPGDAEAAVFLGTADDVGALAQMLRVPNPEQYRGWRVFRGVAEREFKHMFDGRVPPPQDSDEPSRITSIPPSGVVPGEETTQDRGVYSLLSNGAFFAIDVA